MEAFLEFSAMASGLPAKMPNPRASAEWLAVMHATDVIQLAGLRHKLGPDGDIQAAYRRSYETHMLEHDKALIAMLQPPRTECQEGTNGL
jgi:hypothetical protein